MKLFSLICLATLLSVTACAHKKDCCAKDKDATHCPKEKKDCKDKSECKDDKCDKKVEEKTEDQKKS